MGKACGKQQRCRFAKNTANGQNTAGNHTIYLDSFSGQWIGDFIASWVMKTNDPNKYFLNIKLKDVKA